MKLSEFIPLGSGDRDAEIRATLHPDAADPDSVCYALTEAALRRANRNPYVSAILTSKELLAGVALDKGVIGVADPQETYYKLHNRLVQDDRMPLHRDHRLDPSAQIAATAVLGRRLLIGAGVRIAHGVVIHDYSIIGEGTVVEEYAVIGARGMQNIRVRDRFYPVQWAGGVRIGRGCEILTGAVIQRPYHAEYTEIGDEARISVRANIGHRSRVGPRTMIGGSSQVGGNAQIGADVWIGQGSTLSDGIRIGDRAQIKMGSVVVRSVEVEQSVSGNFALDHELHLQSFTRARRG